MYEDHNPHNINPKYHPDFGRIGADVDLGIGMLIAETVDCQYELLGPVSTINEAREIGSRDMAHRIKRLDRGGDPMCPAVYSVWCRNYDGEYAICHEIDATAIFQAK